MQFARLIVKFVIEERGTRLNQGYFRRNCRRLLDTFQNPRENSVKKSA